MPTYLVGPTRTYTTIQQALAAVPSTLTGTGVHEIIVDASGYTTDFFAAISINKAGASASDYIYIHAAAGAEHKGIPSTGVVVSASGTASIFNVRTNFTRIKDICCLPGSSSGIFTLAGNCRFENIITSSGGVAFESNGNNFYINCIAYQPFGVNSASKGFDLFNGDKAYNCCAYGFGTGFNRNNGNTAEVINCWAVQPSSGSIAGFSVSGVGGSWLSSSNNASSDGSVVTMGVGTLVNLTTAQFGLASPGAFNFHITLQSSLRLAGFNLSAVFTTDIDLETITSWSIGPDAQAAGLVESSDEFVCPLGKSYVMDDFNDGALDVANKWTIDVTGGGSYTESGGSFQPANTSSGPSLPTLICKSISFTSAFKISGNYVAGSMEGANGIQWFGMSITDNSTWSRYLALVRQSTNVQSIAYSTTAPGNSLSFTSLVSGITAGTAVTLSIEYDGVSTLTLRSGTTVLISFAKPSGTSLTAYIYIGQYTANPFPAVSTWKLNWAYYWPYIGINGQSCQGLSQTVPSTSSSPAKKNDNRNRSTPDAKAPGLRLQYSTSVAESNRARSEKDASTPNIRSQRGEPSTGFNHNQNQSSPGELSGVGAKRGKPNGYISVTPNLGAYTGAVIDGKGMRLYADKENLQVGAQYRDLDLVGNSRVINNRAHLPNLPQGQFTFTPRSNDILAPLMAHFQLRAGSALSGGTTYYEFTPSLRSPSTFGSSFGTGTYGLSGDMFTVNVTKLVNGSAIRFNQGVCDTLVWDFKASDDFSLTSEYRFKSVSLIGSSSAGSTGSYSTLPSFSGFNSSIDFMGVAPVDFKLTLKNKVSDYKPAGGTYSYYKFTDYFVEGNATIDLSKVSLAYLGSMLGTQSFSISGTLSNSLADRIIFQIPNCRMNDFDLKLGENTISIPFRAYEPDSFSAPIKVMVWTQHYSATTFEPN
jgi:hypothetical protein